MTVTQGSRTQGRLSLLMIVLAAAIIGVLLPATSAEAHYADGDMTYNGCGAGTYHNHGTYGIDAATQNAGLSSQDCYNMYVAIVWYSGSYYSSCSKTSGSASTVTISSNDSVCAGEGPIYGFTRSDHRVKAWDNTWSPTCTMYHGENEYCRF